MTKQYFVMLYSQKGDRFVPLMDGDNLAQFANKEDAIAAGYKNPMGESFGFEVFAESMGLLFE